VINLPWTWHFIVHEQERKMLSLQLSFVMTALISLANSKFSSKEQYGKLITTISLVLHFTSHIKACCFFAFVLYGNCEAGSCAA
jgi:hypothetical protein